MTEFNLEKEPVEVTTTEYHTTNATIENMIASLADGTGDFEGFSGGIEIPASAMDNLIVYGIRAKVEDEEGNVVDKKAYNEVFPIVYIEGADTALIPLCKIISNKSYNSSVGLSDAETRAWAVAFGSENMYTKSSYQDRVAEYKAEYGEVVDEV